MHRNVCLSSVFVDQASEWKLAGVEFLHPHGDIANAPRKFLEALRKYDPPEAGKTGGARRGEKWCVSFTMYIFTPHNSSLCLCVLHTGKSLLGFPSV